MKIKLYIFFSIFVLQTFCIHDVVKAQNQYQKNGIDSAAIDGRIQAEKARRDSIAAAIVQKRKDDSIAREVAKIKLQAFRDSIITARNTKRKADSLLREQAKLALLEKKRMSDSLAQDRIRIQDSTKLARANHSDSMRLAKLNKEKQKKALEKYKNSRHYSDSIAAIKKSRQDSLALARSTLQSIQKAKTQKSRDSLIAIRDHYNDSVKTLQQHINDSTKAAVKANLDKIKTERQRINDSLVGIRKNRADSMAAIRKTKEKKGEETAKKKEEKQKALAIKLFHEKKQQEWTNEKLLKRKWNIPRRIYQNTVTRYNYFYNGRRKYNDAITSLKKANKDDYTQLISLSPFDVRKSGTSVASDMDSVIKKASFSTQIHDPRSKWFDNLYFLMGRASYVKNDFDGAIQTFQFIANEYKDPPKKIKNQSKKSNTEAKEIGSIASLDNRKGIRKLRHHPIRNQALVWLAKSYVEAEQYSEASSLINTLEKDKIFPKRNKADLFLTKANLEIEQTNYNDAIASLEKVLDLKLPSLQRARTQFVIGQLYAMQGDYAQSSAHFKKSISGKANPEMDFYTKLFIAENASKGGGDKQFAVKQLDKLIKDPKFDKYKGQAYNALASIYASDDPDRAIEVLHKSLKSMDSKNPYQKATAYALLGQLYYAKSDYESAKTSYDSAANFGSNPPLPNIDLVNTRKNVLTDVVKNLRIIRKQDSLLALSQKSEKEQKAIAKKEADRLQKIEEAKQESSTVVTKLTPESPTKSNWYFYNNALLEKGASEFRQKWGTRKLEDNWRRSAASTNMMSSNSEINGSEEEKKLLINGSQYETLLAEIPKTPAQKDKANDLVMNAYYDLGLIYYAQLNDYINSVKSLDTLVKRYPSTTFKKQSYYSLFLNHTLLKNEAEAQRYKNLLQTEFGQSEFAKLANNPNYLDELKDADKSVDYYYDTTYLIYKDAKYTEAITRIQFAKQAFKGKKLMAKFDLLQAVCYAGIKEFGKCKTDLEDVIKQYPATKEQVKAQELLNYLNTSGVLGTVDSNLIKKDSIASIPAEIKEAEGKGVYGYDSKSEHLLLIYINAVDGRTMALKSGLSDFNNFKHESEELATGQNLFTVQQGVVIVSKFSNAVFAKIYMNDVVKEESLFKQFTKEDYNVCIISSQNFSELIRTRDILGYLDFYKKNYK